MRALTLAVAVLALAVPAARAATFTVTSDADGAAACSGTSCPSIRAALAAAAASAGADTIAVPAGDFALSQGVLTVDSDVTLTGVSARDTRIHATASPSDRVFFVDPGVTAAISHLTMTGGVADDSNDFFGGDLTNYGTLTLDHVRVTGGSGSSAGGLANRNGTLTILSSLIDHNSADTGGADAGAILNFGGNGGAPATLVVRDTTVAFNSASLVGGISEYGNAGDSTTLERVTVAYNSSGARGGGAVQSDDGIHVRGSLIANNTSSGAAPNCGPNVIDEGGNVEGATDCGFSRQGGNVGLSDGLTDQGGDTDVLQLFGASPAIDGAGACSGADQRDLARPQGEACDAGAFEAAPAVRIDGAPASATRDASVRFSFSAIGGGTGFECRLDTPTDQQAYSPCTSPQAYDGLRDGDYRFLVRGVDSNDSPVGAPAVVAFRVDTAAPAAPAIDSDRGGVLSGSAEPGALVELLENGVVVARTTAGADGRWALALAPGHHVYSARATDAAGNVSAASAPWTVGVATIAQATPAPTPVPGKTVVAARVSGKVLVKRPGAKGFVAIDTAQGIPLGSTVDTTRGRVQITAKAGQVADFYDGIFKITQTRTTTDLTLTQALAPCRKGARAAAKKPKSRKLWGSGTGSFRTRGQYSAATVRGTTWLVQDSCSGTLTRVAQGVVSVRDQVRRKTILLKAGKHYLARPRR